MSKAEVKILQDDIRELNEQVYAGYSRILVLRKEMETLKETIADQQDVIGALAESASGRDNKSNG